MDNEIHECDIDECDASEFEMLFDRFRKLLGIMNDNSNIILDKVYSFKNYSEPEANCDDDDGDAKKVIKPVSILSELSSCLDTLEYNNAKLTEARKALINLVG